MELTNGCGIVAHISTYRYIFLVSRKVHTDNNMIVQRSLPGSLQKTYTDAIRFFYCDRRHANDSGSLGWG